MTLSPGVYASVYGNAIAWDGRKAVDLDVMEVVPADVINPNVFLHPLEDDDRDFLMMVR